MISEKKKIILILWADSNGDGWEEGRQELSQYYEVEIVSDRTCILPAARQRLPDLILSDATMLELNKFQLLRELRAEMATLEVPIVLLATGDKEELCLEGLEAGADDYLLKPFSAGELLTRVKVNLKTRSLRQEAARCFQMLRTETEKARQQAIQILDSTTDAFVALDCEWCITHVNQQTARLNNMQPEEIIGKNHWEMWPGAVGTIIEQEYRRAIAQQVAVHFVAFYEPFGKWFEIHAYPSAGGLGIYYRDITEPKRAREALQETELNFRTLADTMPQMFWTTRPDGYHEYFNQRWYEYTGMTLEQTRGWGWSHLLHPDDRQRCLEIWKESLHTGKDYNIEYRFQRASDGEYRWFLGQAFPLRDENGQIVRWFGSCTDIHDQKIAFFERDRALERERVARASAEAANRIKDEFLAVLSHELRSPLNPILGWSQILRGSKKVDEATLSKGLETIERNAKLQIQLIDDLLDVSRILRGKLHLKVAPVNLAAIVSAAIDTVRASASSKSIQIQTSIEPLVGQVSGDAARLQQVLWNLLSNAVKFTPMHGRVEVCVQQIEGMAQIQVRDTGKGISPDFLPHVFEQFRQADSSITRKFGGLGLGLAIVRHLVELHKGTVAVESHGEGLGATFSVRLPLLATDSETLLNSRSVNETPNLNGMRILVVDDDASTREFLVIALEQYGAVVTPISSALEALNLLAKLQFALLLSDIGMPETDGYSFIRQVRSLPCEQNGQIPAIALTAYTREVDRQLALEAGFQCHLSKPVNLMELLELITRLTGR